MVERRNFHRVPFATKTEINCNEKKFHGELLDISLQGALVLGKEDIPLARGDLCALSINLPDTEVTMQFDVHLVHLQDNRLGFRFIGEDIESMTHLRRLLELNIGSAETVEEEISLWLQDI